MTMRNRILCLIVALLLAGCSSIDKKATENQTSGNYRIDTGKVQWEKPVAAIAQVETMSGKAAKEELKTLLGTYPTVNIVGKGNGVYSIECNIGSKIQFSCGFLVQEVKKQNTLFATVKDFSLIICLIIITLWILVNVFKAKLRSPIVIKTKKT